MPGLARPAYHLYRWLWGSLDLLFPPICWGCDKRGVLWCDECQGKVIEIHPPICKICGQPWDFPGLCRRCSSNKPNFKALRSWAKYEGPVGDAIRRLKYGRSISLSLILAEFMEELLVGLDWQIDLVIPVPLGVARLKERGYNQAALIAKPLALKRGLPYETHGLSRVRETRSQVGLSFDQRLDNVRGAFQANSELVNQRRVLVIDDVATSSATLDACGAALNAVGADEVFGLTLARAG